MKKGKIFGKRQVVLGVLVLALSAAVWLNMRYASSGGIDSLNTESANKNLGDSIYVGADTSAIETSTNADYFQNLRSQRASTRTDAIEVLDSTINNIKTEEETRRTAVDAKTQIALRMEQENSIETLVKAKGFEDVLAVISDDGVNVVVKSDELLGSETLQIQDIVLSQTDEKLENIKIVTVK